MDMEQYDWAHDAFITLNATDTDAVNLDMDASPGGTWPSFAAKPIPVPKLPTQASIARHGQITPPEDSFSPPAMSAQQQQQQQPAELPWEQPPLAGSAPRRRRTAGAKPASTDPPPLPQPPHVPDNTAALNLQPPKRKRGRPKSQSQPQSQPIEGHRPDGFPFPVSTARQSHLEKNRVAAHKCRQRRKEYIDGLEARGREASSKNKQLKESVAILRDEILSLKNEVLRHAGCNFWAVDEYLARCAGDLLGMTGPPPAHTHRSASFSSSSRSGHDTGAKERSMSINTSPDRNLSNSPDNFDDYLIDSMDDKDMEITNA